MTKRDDARRPRARRAWLAAALLFAASASGACAGRSSGAVAAPPHQPAPVAPAASAAPVAGLGTPFPARDTHENLNAVLWMQSAVEYRAAALGAYARAQSLLDRALDRVDQTAALEQLGEPLPAPTAVILDVDETVLDNSPYQGEQVRQRATRFDQALWTRWVTAARADPIPGVVEFLTHARERGVKAVFVTNRDATTEKAATIENLRRLGLDANAENVLCSGERGWTRDKRVRRDFVAKQYRILLLIGDDLGDFVPVQGLSLDQRAKLLDEHKSYWQDRWVVVPNPAYGSWEVAIAAGAAEGDAGVLERKRAVVKGLP
jgi:acid phosphatase